MIPTVSAWTIRLDRLDRLDQVNKDAGFVKRGGIMILKLFEKYRSAGSKVS